MIVPDTRPASEFQLTWSPTSNVFAIPDLLTGQSGFAGFVPDVFSCNPQPDSEPYAIRVDSWCSRVEQNGNILARCRIWSLCRRPRNLFSTRCAPAFAEEAFGVIREAMRSEGKIALGRVVLSTRERLLALEPRDRGILAYSLRTRGEVRTSREVFGAISDQAPDPAMVDIARRIIEQKAGPFDPDQFIDRYEEALKALIATKQKGKKPVRAAEPEDTNVVDLMAALRASLDGDGAPRRRSATKSQAAAAKTRRAPPRRKVG